MNSPIYLDYYEHLRQLIVAKKIAEVMKKIKKKPAKKMTREEIITDSDSTEVINAEIAPDGTPRLYLKGEREPIRIFPDHITTISVSIYKRLFVNILNSIRKQNWIQRIISILSLKYNYNAYLEWIEYIFEIEVALLNEENYSQPTKELRRVLRGRIDDRLLDAITLIIDSDSAYRYRFQDIISIMDKSQLKGYRKTVKELSRLFNILGERDSIGIDIQKIKYKNIEKIIRLALLLPSIRKLLISILKDINIEEIKFSKEDLYHTNLNSRYNFRGLSFEDRIKDNNR